MGDGWGLMFAIELSKLLATLIAAVFVGFYAFIMSRVNKAPSTVPDSICISLIPQNHTYMMYGF